MTKRIGPVNPRLRLWLRPGVIASAQRADEDPISPSRLITPNHRAAVAALDRSVRTYGPPGGAAQCAPPRSGESTTVGNPPQPCAATSADRPVAVSESVESSAPHQGSDHHA